ncbi:MAG: 5-(carboxyamino)imidazole ribonucleotide mutase [Bdellovibrionia bacterium]
MRSKKPSSKKTSSSSAPVVGIIMGSQSDLPTMQAAADALQELGISYEMSVVSAHRTPHEVAKYAENARKKGIRVIIAGAGGAAHLPGMAASYTELPVIGVPVALGPMQGQDALYSIVQMPKGIPVATVAIGNAWNAGVLAAQMLGTSNPKILDRIRQYKDEMRATVVRNSKI